MHPISKRGKGSLEGIAPLLCALFQHLRSLGRLAPGFADPFSVWSYQMQKTRSLAAQDHWRFRRTAMCLCRCGRLKLRGWVGRGIDGDWSALMVP